MQPQERGNRRQPISHQLAVNRHTRRLAKEAAELFEIGIMARHAGPEFHGEIDRPGTDETDLTPARGRVASQGGFPRIDHHAT